MRAETLDFWQSVTVELIGSAAGAFLGALLGLGVGYLLWRKQTVEEERGRLKALLRALREELRDTPYETDPHPTNPEGAVVDFTIRLSTLDALLMDAHVVPANLLEPLATLASKLGQHNDWVAFSNAIYSRPGGLRPQARPEFYAISARMVAAVNDARETVLTAIEKYVPSGQSPDPVPDSLPVARPPS